MIAAVDSDRKLIERYTDQPAQLTAVVRERVEQVLAGEPIEFYALADLDEQWRLARIWLVLSPSHVVLVREDGSEQHVTQFVREDIREVKQTHGLSGTVLSLLRDSEREPLAVLHYSHRQRSAMEGLKFILEQQLAGRKVPLDSADKAYAEAVAEPIKDARASVSSNRLAVVWRLISYLRPYKVQITFGMIAACVMTALNLTPAYLAKHLIDNVIKGFREGDLAQSDAIRSSWWILGILGAVFLLRNFCAWIRLRTMAMVGEYVARDLRDELYGHLHKLSMRYFTKKQTGSIISRVSNDTDRLWDFVAFGIVEVSLAIITLIGLSAVLIGLDWQLGLAMVVPMPLMVLMIYVHSRQMGKLFVRIWRKWSNMVTVVSDTIPGMQVVKAFNRQDYERSRFGRRNSSVTEECKMIHETWTKFWPVLTLTFQALTLVIWMLALPRLLGQTTGTGLSIGTFVSFLLYMGMYMHPIETIGMVTRMLNRATTSAHRVFEILDTEPRIVDRPDSVTLEQVQGRVTFDNVTFGYDQVRQVIKGIDFEVEPGEMIGLVGPSGAGKSTLINLIARFYDVTGGRIMIDGVDIRKLDTGMYRQQVGIVQQDTYLFHGSVLENIRYGRQDAPIDRIIEAARAANAHDFICALPQGYDTMVGERGHTLSGGERQRISIARALLCDPRILILDEATSSVDTETEKKIQEALDRLIPGRTVFAIAHRLSTLRRASRLFVLKEGRVVEVGRHSELLQKPDGVYAQMYRAQQEMHEMYAV